MSKVVKAVGITALTLLFLNRLANHRKIKELEEIDLAPKLPNPFRNIKLIPTENGKYALNFDLDLFVINPSEFEIPVELRDVEVQITGSGVAKLQQGKSFTFQLKKKGITPISVPMTINLNNLLSTRLELKGIVISTRMRAFNVPFTITSKPFEDEKR